MREQRYPVNELADAARQVRKQGTERIRLRCGSPPAGPPDERVAGATGGAGGPRCFPARERKARTIAVRLVRGEARDCSLVGNQSRRSCLRRGDRGRRSAQLDLVLAKRTRSVRVCIPGQLRSRVATNPVVLGAPRGTCCAGRDGRDEDAWPLRCRMASVAWHDTGFVARRSVSVAPGTVACMSVGDQSVSLESSLATSMSTWRTQAFQVAKSPDQTIYVRDQPRIIRRQAIMDQLRHAENAI